ncbi:MAG: hypothetical protein A2580_15025 [Hydrogenophilales bacterium RIFOXYD1_FULL_62_11]|nr:MAG: hypothetical protein A2580_15025 [Hydrogenophilales bacterium RIFOXYD1_FULL_62_11]
MLRLAIFASLALAIVSGAWSTFKEPTAENASKILTPTPEKIEEVNSYVHPYLEWVASQTPDSIRALWGEAAADVEASLEEGASTAATSATSATAPLDAKAPATQPNQPGMDWYMEGGE